MAKKIDTNKSLVSILIVEPSEFKKQLEERIILGKELLNISVKEEISSSYSRYGAGRKIVKYNESEKETFLTKYHKWDAYNTDYLKLAFNIPENDYKKEYENAFYMASIWGSDDIINDQKKTIKNKIDTLESIIERLQIIPCEKVIVSNHSTDNKISSNKIFIVHGHDVAMKEKVARTLTQLKLEPIILHEQADSGKTIIEKFEVNSSEVCFAVILLTADDEGKARSENNYKARARQNVVFEMGYFIGKLGRNRVFLLLESGVEKPGDVDGIVYTPIDNNDGWKLKLVKELKACGYNVSADNLV